jgi:hypothetical protein
MLSPLGVEASHQFEDVPDSSPYHESIAWLVNAGITVGCNVAPPRYCPQASVTREQMAVFLRHAAQTYQVIDANGLMVGRMLRFNDHSATVTFQWRGATHNAEVDINGFVPVGTFFFLNNLTCSGTAYGDERSVAGGLNSFVRAGANLFYVGTNGDVYDMLPEPVTMVPGGSMVSAQDAGGSCRVVLLETNPAVVSFRPAVLTGNVAELGFVPPFRVDLAGLTAQ